MGCSFSSARISRLFSGFWSLFFLMCAQIFFVTSLRGSGCVPTILARCSEGCMGFMKALFVFALPAAFAINSSIVKLLPNQWNCIGIERGGRKASITILSQIAVALNLRVRDLVKDL